MTKTILHPARAALISLTLALPAFAGPPQVVDVEVSKPGMDWRFDITILHEDTGWDHYADGWEVLDADGNRLGYRKLHHPHVDEQPFTRSLSGVRVPDGTREVFIRPRCSKDGWVGAVTKVSLPQSDY